MRDCSICPFYFICTWSADECDIDTGVFKDE